MMQEEDDISKGIAKGYLHNISPLKKDGAFFDFQIQTKYKTLRGVCFSPKKRKLLEDFTNTSSPVKLSKCTLETKCNSQDLLLHEDIVIEKYPEVDFPKKDIDTNLTISDIKSVCIGQLITLKAKVVSIGEVRKVKNGKLSLREVYIADPTDSIKLDLWEENIDKAQEGKTYLFRNLRVKKNSYSSEIYLNTAKSDHFIIKETVPFESPLAIAVDLEQLRHVKEKGEIVGIGNVTSYHACYKCNKKVEMATSDNVAYCTNKSCNLTQKSKACPIHFVAHVDFDNNKEKVSLTIFHPVLESLFKHYKIADNSLNVEGITKFLFQLPEITFIYEKKKKHVTDVIF